MNWRKETIPIERDEHSTELEDLRSCENTDYIAQYMIKFSINSRQKTLLKA